MIDVAGFTGEINYQIVRRKSQKAPTTPADHSLPSFGYGALPGGKHHEKLNQLNGHSNTNGHHNLHHLSHQLPLNGAAGGVNSRRLSSPNEQDEDNVRTQDSHQDLLKTLDV